MSSQKNKDQVDYQNKCLEIKAKFTTKEKKLKGAKKEISSLRSQLKAVKEELKSTDKETGEYLDYLKRLKAEFENYKRRSQKERERIVSWSNEDLIKQFLPVLDDLERAVDSSQQSKNLASLMEGMRMILDQLKAILQKQGLQEIQAKGEEFDPHYHEALMSVDLAEYPDNLVVEEMRKGYKLNDKILRPAMVKVNKRSQENKKKNKSKD
ncbi:nucleotide exchange factor GrpE [Candidatus Aerophobetes bacterium]|uniref:Protein GrpE n=1 Tax=Aerophobetes bacterium TaxID=2030807 RepID=A0A523YND9_UNCAE|nr:MAG: nucleotide exchange factor GrpE [Candidatus Aerophobetes bacterium]